MDGAKKDTIRPKDQLVATVELCRWHEEDSGISALPGGEEKSNTSVGGVTPVELAYRSM